HKFAAESTGRERMTQAKRGTCSTLPICTVSGCRPSSTRNGTTGKSRAKTNLCSLSLSHAHVPTYTASTTQRIVIAASLAQCETRMRTETHLMFAKIPCHNGSKPQQDQIT